MSLVFAAIAVIVLGVVLDAFHSPRSMVGMWVIGIGVLALIVAMLMGSVALAQHYLPELARG